MIMTVVGKAARVLLVFLICIGVPAARAENVDPAADGSRYVYGENVGWLHAEPLGEEGPGLQVDDFELTGWLWGENIGWISLSCKNTFSCANIDYGVSNDGNGVLSGYAWAENGGWMNFSPSTSGVTIDPSTGEFSGYAWAENIGWISFNCANTASCATVDYKVKTGWICDPQPSVPSGSPSLSVDESGSDTLLSWTTATGATGHDIVYGELNTLRTDPDGFVTATLGCLDGKRTTTSLLFAGTPPVGDALWFLVRGQNCGGKGAYGSVKRDTEIPASGNDCP